jgi:hypothetical protein
MYDLLEFLKKAFPDGDWEIFTIVSKKEEKVELIPYQAPSLRQLEFDPYQPKVWYASDNRTNDFQA